MTEVGRSDSWQICKIGVSWHRHQHMDRVVCPQCGTEHDLSELEPSYRWPDAYLAVPTEERAFRAIGGTDDCRVRDAEDMRRQYFLRVLLPVPARGKAQPYRSATSHQPAVVNRLCCG